MNAKARLNILRLIMKADKKQILAGFLLFFVSFFTAFSFFPKDSSADSNQYLNIYSTARNITQGNSNWQKNINANPGDRIMFSIQINANSNINLYNVTISDSLPYQFSYVSGSAKLDGNTASDGITAGGINLGSLSYNQSRTITFEANLSSNQSYFNNNSSFNNYAYAKADNVSQVSDNVQVYVNNNNNGYNNPGNANLGILKTARNITQGNSAWQKNITANPGDKIAFSIKLYSNNNASVYNATLTDTLPYQLSFTSGSTMLDGVSVADGITGAGIFVGSLSGGQTKNITFEAYVASGSNFYSSGQNLTNYAYAKADNIAQISDSAQVTISNSYYQYPYNQNDYQYPYQYQYQTGIRYSTITIRNSGFDPNNLTVKKGDRITFANNDSVAHTVTAPAFGGQHIIQPGQSYALDTSSLNAVQYDYQCDFHPWMRGSILVMDQTPIQQYPQYQLPQIQLPQQQSQQVTQHAVIKAVTGANNISLYAVAAATTSGLFIVFLYFLMQNLTWFTRLRLNAFSLAIKLKERIS